jgi:nicotinamidase-related amidase
MSDSFAAQSALLIMHCQNDIVDPAGLYSGSGAFSEVQKRGVLDKIAAVQKIARKAGMQVIFINNIFSKGYPELKGNTLPICAAARESNSFLEGSWGVENPEAIKPLDGDLVIRNFNTSAFSYTNLDQILRARGIEKLYLSGVATNFVIDSTARYGSELGYVIHVLEDCCASWSAEMHEFEIKHIIPQFGIVDDSTNLIEALNAYIIICKNRW